MVKFDACYLLFMGRHRYRLHVVKNLFECLIRLLNTIYMEDKIVKATDKVGQQTLVKTEIMRINTMYSFYDHSKKNMYLVI